MAEDGTSAGRSGGSSYDAAANVKSESAGGFAILSDDRSSHVQPAVLGSYDSDVDLERRKCLSTARTLHLSIGSFL